MCRDFWTGSRAIPPSWMIRGSRISKNYSAMVQDLRRNRLETGPVRQRPRPLVHRNQNPLRPWPHLRLNPMRKSCQFVVPQPKS